MSIAALDSALTGLRISQQQINLIASNVSNASTPGYTRKILPQESQVVNGSGVGVRGTNVIRNVDLNLERDLWTQISATGFYSIQESYLTQIEKFHGPPDAEVSVAAEIGRLQDSFVALSDNPGDASMLSNTVYQAVDTAQKINDLSSLITSLRNDSQNELEAMTQNINTLLDRIVDANSQITNGERANRSTAEVQDLRDRAISELSELIEIDFFIRGDNTMVVQTANGVELASNRAAVLSFDSGVISASNYYDPDTSNNVAGLIVSDGQTGVQVADLTQADPGGKVGALLELRDEIFPKQMAQLDEMAHKLALRLEAQGLRLFTDRTGIVPADTAPDPTTDPPTPVEYVGFSAEIQVNQAILDDNTLLRSGTYGDTVPTGSNEVINRVIEFGFSAVSYQQAYNTDTTTSVDLLNRGGDDLQTWLGLTSQNELTGGRSLSAFASAADLIASANGTLDPGTDTFRITLEEARTGLGPVDIDIELGAIANGAGNFVQDLLTHITGTVIPALAAGDQADLTAMGVTFSEGSNGEFVINTQGSIVIDGDNSANPMDQAGLDFLGLVDNQSDPLEPKDPYFDIQVGNQNAVRITLEPGDTHTDLITKLQAVDGVAVDTVNFALDGFLRIRPGNDFDNPDFGGALKITGGPFETSGASLGSPPAAAGRTSIDDDVNIVSALFGTYTAGPPVQNITPVEDIAYGSETDGSLVTPPTVSIRTAYLGPGANISTQINSTGSLFDFAQKMVFEHTQQLNNVKSRASDESTLREVLQEQFLNQSGVNIDEELSYLIVFQTSYSASARVISAVEQMFNELLSAI